METFEPSIDWGNDLDSTLWILQVWAVPPSCLLVVLFVVGRTTEWGRQFWRITGGYFKGRQSAPVWAVVGVLLLSAILVGPHQRPSQLLRQRSVLRTPSRLSGPIRNE